MVKKQRPRTDSIDKRNGEIIGLVQSYNEERSLLNGLVIWAICSEPSKCAICVFVVNLLRGKVGDLVNSLVINEVSLIGPGSCCDLKKY